MKDQIIIPPFSTFVTTCLALLLMCISAFPAKAQSSSIPQSELTALQKEIAGINSETSSFSLDAGTQTISLTSLNLFALAVNSSGADRHVNTNTPTTWTLSITGDGSYGTQSASVVDVFAAQPVQGTADPVIDLSSLGDLVAGENYTYRMSMVRNSGEIMFLTLDSFSLEGDITPVPEPSTTALLGLGGLALILRRRK